MIISLIVGFISGGLLSYLLLIQIKKRLEAKKKNDSLVPKSTISVFSGNLKQTSLMDAVQFLELGQREGILHIYCGRRKGYLAFIGGKVIDAFYRDSIGREAVIAMFDIDDGDFYFEPKKIHQPKIITDSIINLAFEWDNRKTQRQ